MINKLKTSIKIFAIANLKNTKMQKKFTTQYLKQMMSNLFEQKYYKEEKNIIQNIDII